MSFKKKVAPVILAGMMAVSMAVPAFAADSASAQSGLLSSVWSISQNVVSDSEQAISSAGNPQEFVDQFTQAIQKASEDTYNLTVQTANQVKTAAIPHIGK